MNLFTDVIVGININQNCNKETKLRFKCLYLNNLILRCKAVPISLLRKTEYN